MYTLYYAPDNASLVVRLALEELGVRYKTILVDRARVEQRSEAYLKLNPQGLIPVLDSTDGPIFETGAILLWLSEMHGALAPSPGHAERASFLKWLFFVSNALHTDLRQLFYQEKYIGSDPDLQEVHFRITSARVRDHLATLDRLARERRSWFNGRTPSVLDLYTAGCLRWLALYPTHRSEWFDLTALPELHAMMRRLEVRPASIRSANAEGLGQTPFSAPDYARPPEGSAT